MPSGVIETILTNAGVAGALLIVMGWAYWKKDKSEKATQVALVKQAERHGQEQLALQAEFVEQLKILSDKRTEDAQRFARELMAQNEANTAALQAVAVTNADVKTMLIEARRDIRTRNRKKSRPEFDPFGGEES